MNIKTTLKLSVTAAALFAIAAPVASPASAGIKNGNKNTLTVSGQVVRALWYGDDGQHEHLFNTTGNSTNTRVRWVASGTLNENVTAGALIEYDIQTSNTGGSFSAVTGEETSGGDKSSVSIRHQYVWVNHKKFGKLSLGQTNAAANGNTEVSLAGTGGLSTPNGIWQGGGITFLDTATVSTGSSTGQTVGGSLDNFDFTSRTDVIRYDTPKFMGFGLAVSMNGAGGGEIGARYSGKFGPVNVVAAAGYSEISSNTGSSDDILGGSIAVLHESGLNASFHIAELGADTGGTDQNMWAAAGGYRAKIFKVGGTNFNVRYNRTLHDTAQGDRGEVWGVEVMQYFDAIGANVALAYRNYDWQNRRTDDTRSVESVDVFGLQAVLKF